MPHFSIKYLKTLLFIGGALSSLGFAPTYGIPLFILATAFLFGSINQSIPCKTAFARGFCFGMGQGAFSMAWLGNALLTEGLQLSFLIPLVWIGMGVLFGLFWAIPAGLAVRWPRGVRRWLAFAAIFTLFEWVRSWLLTGFPWNLVGSIWTGYPVMIQIAAVGGIYTLSLITLLSASVFALWPRKKIIISVWSGMALLGVIGFWRIFNAPDGVVWGVQLRLVQPNIEQSFKWDPEKAFHNENTLLRLSRENNQNITHVLWPESAVPYPINTSPNRLRLMSAVRQGGTLLTGGIRRLPDYQGEIQIANSFFILNDLADVVDFYDKSHLVPFGEYMPLKNWLPLDKLVPGVGSFMEGSGVRTLTIPKAPPAGPLICYEVLFSGEVVQKKHRPEWLINVTNDAWYGLSAGPYQHLAAAQMRAVEEGLPVIRIANTGISAVINAFGEIENSLPLGTQGILDSSLPKALGPTFYALFGVIIPLVLCILLLVFSYKKQNRS